MSYDQHPWEREDEEIREAFANKNAEIERLNQILVSLNDQVEEKSERVAVLAAEVERLTGELEEKEQNLNRWLMEIQRLRAVDIIKDVAIGQLMEIGRDKNQLITGLAEALKKWHKRGDETFGTLGDNDDLLKQAEEETKL